MNRLAILLAFAAAPALAADNAVREGARKVVGVMQKDAKKWKDTGGWEFEGFKGDSKTEVAVVGLHTVFEHHDAMTTVALRAFLHEYRIAFPVGVDAPGPDGPVPQTMQAYGLRGTPSLLLIDRAGRLRRHSFGADEDLAIGAGIAGLLAEA